MAKADRLARLDLRRVDLEADYRDALIAALEVTAKGVWGLFDHNRDRAARSRSAPTIAALTDLADTIDAMREQLGIEPFSLHRDFMASRGPVSSSSVGEPRQAQAWLDRLTSD